MFNVHENLTANGRPVTEGMRVRTNEWREGVVKSDNNESRCCDHEHDRGQVKVSGHYFSDHETNNQLDWPCTQCRHDHWFTVEYDDGGKTQMNGERLFAL